MTVSTTKRNLQLSPKRFGIETSNRFEILNPSSPSTSTSQQPLKKMALSNSCGDLSTNVFSKYPKETQMEETLPSKAETASNSNPLQPLKKMAISTSCEDLHTDADSELPKETAMEESSPPEAVANPLATSSKPTSVSKAHSEIHQIL